jgi:hypothetical protein
VNFLHLSFLDDARRIQDVWKADFESEHTAICWMWIVGGVWALKHEVHHGVMVPAVSRGPGCSLPKGFIWQRRMLYRSDSGESPEAIQQIGAAATSRKTTHPHRGT